MKELTGGQGADYVFVTVGSSAALQQAFSMLAKRGSAVMVGLPPVTDPMLSLPAGEFALTEKTLTGGFMGSTRLSVDIPRLIDLYKAGRYKLDELDRRPVSARTASTRRWSPRRRGRPCAT